jgi:hypothetical protein
MFNFDAFDFDWDKEHKEMISDARKRKLPDGEYVVSMTRPKKARISSFQYPYLERGLNYGEAILIAKEAIQLGWQVEVVGPDSKIYFIGGKANDTE